MHLTKEQAGAASRASRVIKAAPEALYEAFIDPVILVAWLPPAEMTGEFHAFDARVGGGYRMSLFYPAPEDNEIGSRLSLEQLARRFEG